MSQAVEFSRQQDYTDFQDFNAEGSELNREFDNAKITIDQLRANINLLQKDDGALANGIVGNDQLHSEVLSTIDDKANLALQAKDEAILARNEAVEAKDLVESTKTLLSTLTVGMDADEVLSVGSDGNFEWRSELDNIVIDANMNGGYF
jgi:hypothetical protein